MFIVLISLFGYTVNAQNSLIEGKFLNNADEKGLMLEGNDPVAYFTQNKAVKGNEKYQSQYQSVTYYFSSEANKVIFDDNPHKYAPQYGGFCAYAVSLGILRPIDTNIFQFVDGRLMFQHTQDAYNKFNKDTTKNTQKADKNWPPLVKKKSGKKVTYDKPAN